MKDFWFACLFVCLLLDEIEVGKLKVVNRLIHLQESSTISSALLTFITALS